MAYNRIKKPASTGSNITPINYFSLFLLGKLPFYNQNTDIMFGNILVEDVRFPRNVNISAEARDLLLGLLGIYSQLFVYIYTFTTYISQRSWEFYFVYTSFFLMFFQSRIRPRGWAVDLQMQKKSKDMPSLKTSVGMN